MRRPPRIAVLIVLLVGLAVWVAIDLRSPPAATKSAATPTAAPVGPSAQTSTETQRGIPARPALRRIGSDPFSPQSWRPPPKPAAASAPPAPVTPPLPFRFAGQFHRDSGVEVYLARGEEVFAAREGDTLDGQYKVEAVRAAEVTFVYLPTGVRQPMQFSALREQEFTARGEPVPPARALASAARSPAPLPAATAKGVPGGNTPASLSDGSSQGKHGPAQLRWDGPSSARAGASFNVALRVTSGEQIRSAPMQVRFDPAVLESISVRAGRYFGAEKAGSFGYRVNPDGSIFIGVSNQVAAPASDAEFLVLTFKPIRPAAAAEISVASLNLQGAAGRAIAYGTLASFKTTITP